jgi:hypothetical protein
MTLTSFSHPKIWSLATLITMVVKEVISGMQCNTLKQPVSSMISASPINQEKVQSLHAQENLVLQVKVLVSLKGTSVSMVLVQDSIPQLQSKQR